MSEISFKSTFKIPMSQWGINNTKKLQLKSLVGSYNGIVTKGKDNYAVLSISDNKDKGFLCKLRRLGYFQFEQFKGEKIPKESLIDYVKQQQVQLVE